MKQLLALALLIFCLGCSSVQQVEFEPKTYCQQPEKVVSQIIEIINQQINQLGRSWQNKYILIEISIQSKTASFYCHSEPALSVEKT